MREVGEAVIKTGVKTCCKDEYIFSVIKAGIYAML